jgi:hypothetical protein
VEVGEVLRYKTTWIIIMLAVNVPLFTASVSCLVSGLISVGSGLLGAFMVSLFLSCCISYRLWTIVQLRMERQMRIDLPVLPGPSAEISRVHLPIEINTIFD